MNNLKRIAILFAVFTVLIIFSIGYKGNAILKRAIVLGVGVDFNEDGTLTVTAEIVSPGNGGEEVGTFSKIVSATGQTVGEGLQKIAEKSGKETSLGQCVLIVLGENYIKENFKGTTDFFVLSDSCKESCMICCCKGTAQEFINQKDAVAQSVSLSVADKLKGLSKDVAMPSMDILRFARSQNELYKTGFLNYVEFEKSQNTDSNNTEKKQGFFSCDKVAVFRENKLVGVLSTEETRGFAVLSDSVNGNVYSVENEEKSKVILRANTKKVDSEQQDGVVTLSVEMQVKLARTDSFGAGGKFTAKTEEEISQNMLDQAKNQAQEEALLFLKKQKEWDFDLLDFHELFRRQHGDSENIKTLPMKEIAVKLTVEVKEK